MKEGDSWERQTAIFALDDLTETSNYPEGSIPAMKKLIPEIATATKAKDRVLSEMADEGPDSNRARLQRRTQRTCEKICRSVAFFLAAMVEQAVGADRPLARLLQI